MPPWKQRRFNWFRSGGRSLRHCPRSGGAGGAPISDPARFQVFLRLAGSETGVPGAVSGCARSGGTDAHCTPNGARPVSGRSACQAGSGWEKTSAIGSVAAGGREPTRAPPQCQAAPELPGCSLTLCLHHWLPSCSSSSSKNRGKFKDEDEFKNGFKRCLLLQWPAPGWRAGGAISGARTASFPGRTAAFTPSVWGWQPKFKLPSSAAAAPLRNSSPANKPAPAFRPR